MAFAQAQGARAARLVLSHWRVRAWRMVCILVYRPLLAPIETVLTGLRRVHHLLQNLACVAHRFGMRGIGLRQGLV